jgi:hypothetical protein
MEILAVGASPSTLDETALKHVVVRLGSPGGRCRKAMRTRIRQWTRASALTLVASLGACAWLSSDLFHARSVADEFMADLTNDGTAAGSVTTPCPSSGVAREAFRPRAIGEVDWDFGFRAIRTRDGQERLSRQGYLRDDRSGEERWFKLTLQREDDGTWCVMALSVDAQPKKFK